MGSEVVLRSDITRRGFLGGVAAGAAVLAISSPARALVPREGEPMPVIVVRRREDLLRLTIRPVGMTIDKATGRMTPTGETGLLIVDFGPQSVIERAVEPGTVPGAPLQARMAGPSHLSFVASGAVGLSLASLLAWAEREPYIHQLGRYLDGEVLPSNLPLGKPPNPSFTWIEMPWRLVLSPHRASSWTEQLRAKTSGGRTEVFHARLGSRLPGEAPTEDPAYNTVRGIWIRDERASELLADPNLEIATGQPGKPWLMVPDPRDRADIVRLTQRTGANELGGKASAVKARIALSPLGGQLVAEGSWDEPGVSSLLSWQQRIWQGRDTYAKVVRRGFLYPWGFTAAEVEEGVRVFRADSRGAIRAFWELRTTIVVTQPEADLAGNSAASEAGKRAALFSQVICKTVQTPPLVQPRRFEAIGDEWVASDGSPMRVYTPRVATRSGTSPFAFDLVGIDPDGNEIPFTQPLLYAQQRVEAPEARSGGSPRFDLPDPNFSIPGSQQLRDYYDSAVPYADKAAQVGGAVVAFAENLANSVVSDEGEVLAEGSSSGGTSQPVKDIVFGMANSLPGMEEGQEALALIRADVDELIAQLTPNNFPIIKEAQVYIQDAEKLARETVTAALNYPREYLENALDEAKNKGQVYLQAAENAANELLMDAAAAGGLVSPNLTIAGLSRTLGSVYGDAQALKALINDGKVTPGEAFKALELLGGITLADLIPNPYPAVDENGEPTGMALVITSEFLDTGLPSERNRVTMSMDIDTRGDRGREVLQSIPIIDVDRARLSILAETTIPTQSGEATWAVRGEFSDFIVHLVPIGGMEFVSVDVARILFTAGSGKSPNVDVDVREVDFTGLLTLIKSLASYLPFGDLLVIDVDREGIQASFFLELPPITLGAAAISGIGVGAKLGIPFGSGPVRFGFLMSTPDDPFSLTLMGLGGGGYLDQALGLRGIERLSIAGFLEASVKVDFGVASGGVIARAGFQFAIGADEGLALTAFASLDGHLDVLGIASASMDVYVGLTATIPSDLPDYARLRGVASCTLRVSVAFFSESVTFQVERSFKMAYIDPPGARSISPRSISSRSAAEIPPATFDDAWSERSWADFCEAFA